MGRARGSRQVRARPIKAWTIAAALALVATACGSRLSHERLLADGSGASRRANLAPAGEVGVPGDASAASPAQAGAPVPGSLATSGANGVSPAAGSPEVAKAGGGGGANTPIADASAAGCSAPKAPFTIGTVGQQSGVAGSALGPGPKAVQAWVAGVNARGGLGCHAVRYIIADDGGDPSRHQALVKELIEQDHIIAFVFMNSSLTGQSSVSYITEKRVPVVGGDVGSAWFNSSSMYFPEGGVGEAFTEASLAAVAEAARPLKKSKLGVVACVEDSFCSTYYDVGAKYAAKYGMNLVYRNRTTVVQPDYTPQCQAAQGAGAEILFVALDGNSISRAARSCASVNYHPFFATASLAASPSLASDPNVNGLVVGMDVLPWMVATNPNIREYQETLTKYAPGVSLHAASIEGWVAAKLFELAASHLADRPSSQDVLDGLWSIKNNDLGGLTQPLTFTKDRSTPRAAICFWQVQLIGGRWTSPNGGQRICKP